MKPIVWLGLSFDNPYFSTENIQKYVHWVTNFGYPFSVHLTDCILPFSIQAKHPELSNAEIQLKAQKMTADTLKMLEKLNVKLSGSFEIVVWSSLLKKNEYLNQLVSSTYEHMTYNKAIHRYLEPIAIAYVENHNQKRLSGKLKHQALQASKTYLLLETIISTYLRENTPYAIEITPYESIGIVNQLYTEYSLKPLKEQLVNTNVDGPSVYKLKFSS